MYEQGQWQVEVHSRLSGTRKQPATLRVHLMKYRKIFSFAGSFAGFCKEIYDHMYALPANNPQITRKSKFGFAKYYK
jgi:hypothetical protein